MASEPNWSSKNRHLRLRQTFAGYVVASLSQTFWDEEVEQFVPSFFVWKPTEKRALTKWARRTQPRWIGSPPDPEDVKGRLLRSYDARSSYVHEGRTREQTQSSIGERLSTGAEGRRPSSSWDSAEF